LRASALCVSAASASRPRRRRAGGMRDRFCTEARPRVEANASGRRESSRGGDRGVPSASQRAWPWAARSATTAVPLAAHTGVLSEWDVSAAAQSSAGRRPCGDRGGRVTRGGELARRARERCARAASSRRRTAVPRGSPKRRHNASTSRLDAPPPPGSSRSDVGGSARAPSALGTGRRQRHRDRRQELAGGIW
jgi:hypothetical protein